jgi:hypothetical protein
VATTRRTVYIDPTGSDTSGQGTQLRPFRTVERARSLIRQRGWNSGMATNQVVNIAPGDYWNHGTATLTEADSGSNGFSVVYQCSGAPGTAKLNGGIIIDPASWVLVSGSVYKTPLPGKVYTMWENGVRGRAARLPKLAPGVGFPCARAPYFTSAGVSANSTTLQYNPVDFDPSTWTLGDIGITDWSSFPISPLSAWFSDTHGLTARDTTAKQFTLDNNGLKFDAATGATGSRYFVSGALPMLTEAGEFVCTGGFLYYWARDGAIASQQIVVPTTQDLISMKGNSTSTRVSNVQFDGLALQYTDFDSWYRFGDVRRTSVDPYGWQRQNANVRHGLVYMENTDHCKVTRCHGKNSGFAGLYMREYGQQNTIQDCWFEYAGTSTVYVEGRGPGEGDIIGNNTYWDLKLNNFGELAGDGEGLHLNQSGNNVLRYMLIQNGPRYGVELSGWNVDGTGGAGVNYTTGNVVSFIKIQNVAQDSGDMGALTCNFFNRAGVNTFDQIIIDGANAHSSMLDAAPNGVFLDNETDGQHLSNIQVGNVGGALFRTNDSPAGTHVITNCSFLPNGSANPSFNPALMDAANIGTTSAFPY